MVWPFVAVSELVLSIQHRYQMHCTTWFGFFSVYTYKNSLQENQQFCTMYEALNKYEE